MLNLLKVKKVLLANPAYWTCPRCGTTNHSGLTNCKECKNHRPW